MKRSIRGAWLISGFLLFLTGCDSSNSAPYVEGSTEEANVKGTVKAKGKTLPAGIVSFNATNTKRIVPAREAPIAADGSFALKALVGQNIVTVHTPRNLKGADARNKIYAGLEYVEKTVDIKAGEDIVLELDFTP